MAGVLPSDKLAETWDALLAQLGKFKEIVRTRTQTIKSYQVVFVTCAFAKSDVDVKVVFNANGQIAGMFFVPPQKPSAEWSPPGYVESAGIHEQDVKVGESPWQLPGVLTLPSGSGPFPGIVLVHGSGPQDADETIGPNKPFKDLAWGLASRGIVALRYSKRTLVYGAKLKSELFTVRDETMDDARAAVELLTHTPEVDPKRIYLTGHSMGGMLAPRIASNDAEIRGIVILDGPSRPIEQCLVEQTEYLAKLMPNGEGAEQIRIAQELGRQIEDPNLKPERSSMCWGRTCRAHIGSICVITIRPRVRRN